MLSALLTLSLFIAVNGIDDCKIGPGIQKGQMDDKDMEEASGLAYSMQMTGFLYTINDKGGLPRVITLTEDGQKNAFIELDGVDNIDYEDIAMSFTDGRSWIYVSDTGNNDFDRDNLSILKFQEPTATGNDVVVKDIEDLQVRYDGFSYDCEALAVDQVTGDFFMFTKDRENSISEVYRYPYPQSVDKNPFTLEHVATLPLFWITGGDISPDGRTLVLTNKQEAYKYDKMDDSVTWSQFLVDNPEPSCILRLEEEEQREAIAVTMEGIWTTSECKDDPPCPLWFYSFNTTKV